MRPLWHVSHCGLSIPGTCQAQSLCIGYSLCLECSFHQIIQVSVQCHLFIEVFPARLAKVLTHPFLDTIYLSILFSIYHYVCYSSAFIVYIFVSYLLHVKSMIAGLDLSHHCIFRGKSSASLNNAPYMDLLNETMTLALSTKWCSVRELSPKLFLQYSMSDDLDPSNSNPLSLTKASWWNVCLCQCTSGLPPSVVTVDWARGEYRTPNSPIRDLPRNGWNWMQKRGVDLLRW